MISSRFVAVGVLCSVLGPTPARAQGFSFSSMRPAEECADYARRLSTVSGNRLAVKLRKLDSTRWFSIRDDDAIEARFIRQFPCLAFTFERAKCPDLQSAIDETVGDTLGERLRLIFPKPTADMRDMYAEMFVRSFCPDLKGPAAQPVITARDESIAVLVEAPPIADGFVPPEMVGLRVVMKALNVELFKPRRKLKIVQARNKAVADTVVAVTDVESAGGKRTVRAKVTVEGKSFNFDATADDNDFVTAADALAVKIVDWIEENQARIVQGHPK